MPTYTLTYIHIPFYIYLAVCIRIYVCVYVCMPQRHGKVICLPRRREEPALPYFCKQIFWGLRKDFCLKQKCYSESLLY